MAGRSTPGSIPKMNDEAATTAPVFPALTKASPRALPAGGQDSLRMSMPMDIEEALFLRMATVACSSIPTTSGAWTISILAWS